MKETARTIMFVAAAGVSVAAALAAHWISRPAPLEGFERVGTEFFPDFQDPNEPKALRVVAYNEDTATVREFEVKFQDGRWRIPSRHNYPADAQDRLANTAASVIGIKRGALASRREGDHEQYGVIDPMDEDVTALRGRGERITLTREDGTVLADYIIGKRVEGPGREGHYYVRQPREKETYITQLDIDLSTRFADWIESDLLKLNRDDLIEVVVDKYSIDERRGAIVDKEVSRLTRDSFSDPWELEGLDEETEELDSDAARELVNQLDDLQIVGVRPKPQGINADLTVDESLAGNPLLLNALRSDLAERGFLIGPGDDGEPRLYSREGEVIAATNDGVEHVLHFGQVFTGSEFEVEVGFASGQKPEQERDAQGEAADPDGNSSEGDEEEAADGEERKRSRYLFVTAHFSPERLGDPPQEPVKPEKPADTADEPAEPDRSEADGENRQEQPDSTEDTTTEEGQTDEETAEEETAEVEDGSETEESEKPEKSPESEYEAALAQYEEELEMYHNDVKLYEDRLEQGRERVDELNSRFGEWYYVISAESFEGLRLSRSDLVKPREQPDDEAVPQDAAPAVDPASLPEVPSAPVLEPDTP